MRKLLFILAVAMLIAGCKSGGGGSGSVSSSGGSPLYSGITSESTDLAEGADYSNPEPSTMVLFGIGLAGLAARGLRKNKRS